MERNESVGFLLRYILYHFKSIEERLNWSKAIHKFKQNDKHTINKAIQKVAAGINDLISIVHRESPALVTAIKADVQKTELVYYMTLTEQLFDLREEDLDQITDMIDTYLKNKYYKNDTERLNDTQGDGAEQHSDNGLSEEAPESCISRPDSGSGVQGVQERD